MNEMTTQLARLSSRSTGPWSERIIAELDFAIRLSRLRGRRHDALLRSAIASLAAEAEALGAITRELVEETEQKLAPIAAEAKALTLLCASHAHIDMNWLWRYDETVSITLDTFRTVLALMAEYPAFTFSQSQASVYRIVEEHDPELLKEIRRRVKEGRWEVTASTWVETDKNIPSGESLARHLLYTRRLMARLFDLGPEDVRIDFEPDTFGHSRNVPEIANRGGVRYYYHCRGEDEHSLYRWRSPSGAELLVYRDLHWYNSEVSPAMAAGVPEFCHRFGMDTMLRVYGVGDHGGGPTRRDLDRIVAMDTWPIFPKVRFGTLHQFFALAEQVAEKLPVVDRELNPMFTGCYTTQTRIKAGNRAAEARLYEAEAFSALASLAVGHPWRGELFAKSWEHVLFNHFHDIIPGSGIVDTREYALGLYQQVQAAATTEQTLALRRIAARVDTAGLAEPPVVDPSGIGGSIAEGAGVGWGIDGHGLARVDRGRGLTRVFVVFNPAPRPRAGVVELVVWDWDGERSRLVVKDSAGQAVPHEVLENEPHRFFGAGDYWGHKYLRVLAHLEVPAFGWTTCTVSEASAHEAPLPFPGDPRVERPDSFVLENDLLRAVFDTSSCALVSLVDKAGGEELLDPSRPAGEFRHVEEDDAKRMTAWTVGRWMSVRSLHDRAKVAARGYRRGTLRQSLTYGLEVGRSHLTATVSLDRDSPVLRWDVHADWLEVGGKDAGVPQLNFHLPLAGEHRSWRYDVPFGTVDRAPVDLDLPANSWVAAVPRKAGRRSVMLVAGQKHGFRCFGDAISLTLIRSSYDPDPYPELGEHRFDFGICLADGPSNASLAAKALEYRHGCSVVSVAPPAAAPAASLPRTGSLLELEPGSLVLAAVKMPEEGGRRLVVRLAEVDGREATATIRFAAAPTAAWLADLLERRLQDAPKATVEGRSVSVTIAPHAIATLVVEFAGAGS